MKYVLITPCRDEEDNLPYLAESILAQSVRPILWVIVDDGSSDGTPSIIKDLEEQFEWIKGLHLTESGEYMGFHYSRVCREGFDFAAKKCSESELSHDHVALVDADNILDNQYFENLMYEFHKNTKLGIASGINAYIDSDLIFNELKIQGSKSTFLWDLVRSGKVKLSSSRDDVPMGSARIWRKECFDETGGFLFTHSPDSVSNIKAQMLGWETRRFSNALVIERPGLVAQGMWQGYKKRGGSDYYIWYPLSFSILKAVLWSRKSPHYLGIAFLYGYLISYFKRAGRLDDLDVRDYNRTIRSKKIKSYYITKLKRMLRVWS